MELYQIRYALALSETLNFTRAAEKCFISQPALTKAIQRLEETLSGDLFVRNRQKISLTPLGISVLPNLRTIYDTANKTRQQARALMQDKQTKIRIGVMCTINLDFLLPVFTEFNIANPDIDLYFYENTLEGITDALDKQEIDIAIASTANTFSKRFHEEDLFDENYVVAYGAAHRYHCRNDVLLEELNDELYCDRINCEYSNHIENVLIDRNINLKVVHESTREDWIQSLVRSNMGIACMPLSLAKHAKLSFVNISDCPFTRTVKALVTSHSEQPDIHKQLIECLKRFDWQKQDLLIEHFKA